MAAGLLLASAAQAQLVDQLTDLDHACAGDVGNVGTCNAGEIKLATVSNVAYEGKPGTGGTCYIGEKLTVATATVEYAIGTQARYNLMLWLGREQGTDPAEGSTINGAGRCVAASLPGPFDSNPPTDPSNPFLDLDQNGADVCGDLEAYTSPPNVQRTFTGLELECQDNDNDGFADLNLLLTWQQKSSATCGTGPADEPSFPIGSPSKCDRQILNSTLQIIEPATLTVVKNTIGGDDAFDLTWSSTNNPETEFSLDTVSGSGMASQEFLIATGLGDSNFEVAEILTAPQQSAGWTFVSAECVNQEGTSIGTPSNLGITGMTIDEGDAITCTFTNAAPASLTLRKRSIGGTNVFPFSSNIPGFGTPAAPGAWTLQLDTNPTGEATFTKADIPISDAVNGDDYSITEITPGSWVLQSVVCNDGQTSNTETLAINLQPGDDITCTYTNTLNASVTINKETRGGDGSFDFTTNALEAVPSGQFNITTSGNSGAAVLGSLPAGTYTVSELVPAGWDLVSLSCTESGIQNSTWELATATAMMRLEVGETITCNYVDEERAKIQVVKDLLPVGLQETFTFQSNIPNNSSFSIDAPGSITFLNLVPGQYTVTEDEPGNLGYDFASLGCVDGDTNGTDSSTNLLTATINLDPGETVTCTYTNRLQGSITVRKLVTADGPTNRTFGFTGDLGNFFLGPVSEGAAEELVFNGLEPGTYGVLETDPTADGWFQVGSFCSDGSSPAAIDLAAGEDVVCTFVNAPLGSATVLKNTVGGDGQFQFSWGTPNNGSIPEGANPDFDLTTSFGTAFQDFSFSLLVDNPYDLTEVGNPAPVGPYGQSWTKAGIGCIEDVENDSIFDPGENGADATLVAQTGETVACTFLNTLDGTLVIRKESTPEALGDTFTFEGDVAGGLRDYSTTGPDEELFLTVAPSTIVSSEEQVPAGYRLTDITCVGATNSAVTIGSDANFPGFEDGDTGVTASIAAGETVICTFTNEKEGSITINKNTIGGDGTFAFGGDLGSFQIDTSQENDEVFTDLLTGTYLVSETVPYGWNLTDISCTGAVDSVITIGGSGGFNEGDTGVSIDLAPGEDILCTFTNTELGSITVAKETLPDGSVESFTFTGDAAGSITDGAAITVSDLLPGTYTSTETVPAGWDLVDIQCDDGASATPSLGDVNTTTATFNVDPGEDINCAFTNVQRATVIVQKVVVRDDGGNAVVSEFGINSSAGTLNFDGGSTVGDVTTYTATVTDVVPGTGYSVSETPITSYTPGNWSCTDDTGSVLENGGDPTGALFTVNPGQTVTCAITNDDIAPTLTLIKNVINDNGGNALPDDFGISVGGAPVTSGESNPYAANTPLAIDEVGLAGYSFVSITGDAECPEELGEVVVLPEGENVTCTITNDDQPPGLTLVKEVVNDNGGTEVASAWTLSAGPHDVTGSETGVLATDQAGTYSLSETEVSGYTNTSITCSNSPGEVTSVTLGPGEDVTCTFVNDDDAPSLILVKNVINDNGGTEVASAWTLSAGPHDVTGSEVGALATDQAGTYPLSETTVAGYTNISITCSNSPGEVTSVTLELGEYVTCTFVNDDDAPTGLPTQPPGPAVPVPVNQLWALLLLFISMLATAWHMTARAGRR